MAVVCANCHQAFRSRAISWPAGNARVHRPGTGPLRRRRAERRDPVLDHARAAPPGDPRPAHADPGPRAPDRGGQAGRAPRRSFWAIRSTMIADWSAWMARQPNCSSLAHRSGPAPRGRVPGEFAASPRQPESPVRAGRYRRDGGLERQPLHRIALPGRPTETDRPVGTRHAHRRRQLNRDAATDDHGGYPSRIRDGSGLGPDAVATGCSLEPSELVGDFADPQVLRVRFHNPFSVSVAGRLTLGVPKLGGPERVGRLLPPQRRVTGAGIPCSVAAQRAQRSGAGADRFRPAGGAAISIQSVSFDPSRAWRFAGQPGHVAG